MKALFWAGLVALILGVALFLVPIPHYEREGLQAGGMSVSVETRSEKKVSPIVSAVLILAGAGMMIAAKRRV